MRVSTKWVVLWSLWAARLVRQPTTHKRVSGGRVRGSVSIDGTHAAYVGIPYASIEGRFQGPGPEPMWDEVYDAINSNTRCLQYPIIPLTGVPRYTAVGQEDCLKINVYTPAFPYNSHLPVMVFIHGGGFTEGSAYPLLYSPNYIVSKGVILVTFNCRIHMNGFLNLGIEEAPGNAGMKDQVAALKWVQRNIRAFGGDPDNVTLFGESSGGASVSYHLLSPMSKGLFHRVIIQSGSSLCPWAFQAKPKHYAHELAKSLGYHTRDPHELYKIFNNLPLCDLISAKMPKDDRKIFLSTLIYSPSVENKFEGIEPFLTEEPHKLLSNGSFTKVPMIIGTTDEEGYFFTGLGDADLSACKIEHSLPNNLNLPTEDKRRIAEEIKRMYMGDATVSTWSGRLKLSKFHGDAFVTYPTLAEAELLLKSTNKPIYNYCFKYNGWRNMGKVIAGWDFVFAPGATHADDLFHLFYQSFLSWLLRSDFEMIDKMTTLWTNFAKYGDPTPGTSKLLPRRWSPTSLKDPHAFVLDREHTTVSMWFTKTLEYWRDLYSKYGRK